LAGAIQETWTAPLPRTTVTPVGGSGTVAGVTADDAVEAGPIPTSFVAVTVKVYGVPLVRPVTVQVRASVVVHVIPSGELVTV
jgi:hypothetical protein